MNKDGGWSPYVAGGLSGLVSIGSVWFVGKYLGATGGGTHRARDA